MVRRVNNVFVAWVGRRCFWVNSNELSVLKFIARRGVVSNLRLKVFKRSLTSVGLLKRLCRRGLLCMDVVGGESHYFLGKGVRLCR